MRVRRHRPCPVDICLWFGIFLGRIYLLLLIDSTTTYPGNQVSRGPTVIEAITVLGR